MRYAIIVLSMTFGLMTSAAAQLSIGFNLPGVSIGVNVPIYPDLVQVPGYPVYYAPRVQSNLFFYDGMYWVYQGDNWYASSWYNGPWGLVSPELVPVFVLRVPVRYYRAPPTYFRGWQSDAPPRWGEHWGNSWQEHRSGWDQWNRNSAPAPAPLPVYQRQYSADRYPQAQQQQALRSQNYHYQPSDPIVRQHFQEPLPAKAPAAPQQALQMPAPVQRAATPRPGGEPGRRPQPIQAAPQPKAPAVQEQKKQPLPVAAPREQQAPAVMQRAPQPKAPVVQEQKKQPPPVAAPREQQAPAVTQRAPQPKAPAVQEQKKPPEAAPREQPPPPAAKKQESSRDKGDPPEQQR